MTYYYDDGDGHHEITLKRGSPEWANHDCPDIYEVGSGWMLSNGLIIETGMEEEMPLICEFMRKSFIAYYKKYNPEKVPADDPRVNGFLGNFITSNLRFKSIEWLHEVAPWTKDYADAAWEQKAKKLQRDILDAYADTRKFHSITNIRND